MDVWFASQSQGCMEKFIKERGAFWMALKSTQQTLYSVFFLCCFTLATVKRLQLGVGDRIQKWQIRKQLGAVASSPPLFLHLSVLTRPPPPAPRSKHIRATHPDGISLCFCELLLAFWLRYKQVKVQNIPADVQHLVYMRLVVIWS